MQDSPHSALCRYVSEFLGTYFLVLTIGCNVLTGSVSTALSVGTILMVMIYSLYSVSGAHFNPAVTLAVKISGRNLISMADVIFYIISQIIGGIAAGLTYSLIFGSVFVMAPTGKFTALSAGVCEVVYTTALCYVVLNVATTEKQASNEYFGLASGFTVVAAALAIGGISGCCLNPAVSVAAASVAFMSRGVVAFRFLHVYIFAPFIGSAIASLCFYIVQREDEYARQGSGSAHEFDELESPSRGNRAESRFNLTSINY